MAWVDCMRWRRAASIVRGIGWGAAGIIFCSGAAATFVFDLTDNFVTLAVSGASCLIVLGLAYAIGWLLDQRGDRLIAR